MKTDGSGQGVLSYFWGALAVTFGGLVLGAWVGWEMTGTQSGMLSILFICAVLAVLEISLSFDNAIINANKLKDMTPQWQHRFLTWGIIIAVFGMRIVFPLLIVVIAAKVGPWQAVTMAASRPDEYARIMHEAHLPIAAFGGTFLMMVALVFFCDEDKKIHWIPWIEEKATHHASVKGFEVLVVMVIMLIFTRIIEGILGPDPADLFFHAAIWGLVTFLMVEVLGNMLDRGQAMMAGAAKGGLGAFLYLEVLDASFSFDGVIGAFALSQNIFVIAIGLGIGAMYVRSMTIMLVEKGTLTEYRFLENGAFWAILILSVIMYLQVLFPIPEVITGLGGAVLIGLAFWSSVRWNRRHRVRGDATQVTLVEAGTPGNP